MGYTLSSIQVNGKTKNIDCREDILFWMHNARLAVPNDVWTPFPFNNVITALGEDRVAARYGRFARPTDVVIAGVPSTLGTTTIAAGSNGLALPQGTINVASTEPTPTSPGFEASGYILIKPLAMQAGGATDTIVKYTSKNATQFLGCTLGTGTMVTGDAIIQANVHWEKAGAGGPATCEMAWEHNAIGVRGCGFKNWDGFFNFDLGTDVRQAAAAASPNAPLRTMASEQPVGTSGLPPGFFTGIACQVYQNSGGVLNTFSPIGLSAPRLVFGNLMPVEVSTI